MEAVKVAEKMLMKKLGDPADISEFVSKSPTKKGMVEEKQASPAEDIGLSARSAAGAVDIPQPR